MVSRSPRRSAFVSSSPDREGGFAARPLACYMSERNRSIRPGVGEADEAEYAGHSQFIAAIALDWVIDSRKRLPMRRDRRAGGLMWAASQRARKLTGCACRGGTAGVGNELRGIAATVAVEQGLRSACLNVPLFGIPAIFGLRWHASASRGTVPSSFRYADSWPTTAAFLYPKRLFGAFRTSHDGRFAKKLS